MKSSMELLLNLVDASYKTRNVDCLEAASREINPIRYLLGLAKDLRIISIDNHEFAAQAMDEVGRMTGGWLKSARREAPNGL